MVNITKILEDAKKQVAQSHITSFTETYEYEENGGTVIYPASVEYEIIGAFLEDDRIKLVIVIKKIECHENVLDTMIENFKKQIQNEFTEKNSELDGNIEIIPIKMKGLKKLSEFAFEL